MPIKFKFEVSEDVCVRARNRRYLSNGCIILFRRLFYHLVSYIVPEHRTHSDSRYLEHVGGVLSGVYDKGWAATISDHFPDEALKGSREIILGLSIPQPGKLGISLEIFHPDVSESVFIRYEIGDDDTQLKTDLAKVLSDEEIDAVPPTQADLSSPQLQEVEPQPEWKSKKLRGVPPILVNWQGTDLPKVEEA